jgi:hypothetical protein
MKNQNSAKPAKTCAFELRIIRLRFVDLLIAALDDESQRTASAVIGWINRYRHTRGEVDCFICGSVVVGPPPAVVVLLPLRAAGRRAIVGAICSTCHGTLTGADLMDGAMRTIRGLMPSAQLHVTPVHGGRA